MADPDAPTGDGDNTEYRIRRRPDLQMVTAGARIHYACEWIGPSAQPTAASENNWGPRDGIRWYTYSNQPPTGWFEKRVKPGPLTAFWDRTWTEDPGQYTVIAEIRSRLDDPGTAPTYRFRSQLIGQTGAVMKDWLDKLLKTGDAPSPDDAEKEIGRYRSMLNDIAKRFPPPDPKKHQAVVDKWTDLAGRLRGLLSPSDTKRRVPVRGLHLEFETQARRPLMMFLAEMGEVTRAQGRGGLAKKKHWALVDWTDPSDPRFRGIYDGEGADDGAAIEACFSTWDWDNRYPEGNVSFEIPPELRGIVVGPVRRQMDTNGKNFTDQLIIIFEWIAIGAMLVAGFCFIFVAIPALTSAAVATSMLASTAGAVFSISQRWRDGIFDWQADAIDGLSIVGNLVGAGAWARGARVKLLGQGAKKLDFVFLGARVATDAAQGVLIAASRIDELDRLIKDPNFPPEERARKILAVLAELTALGMMTAISFRASAKEADNLTAKPKHLGNDPRANIADDRLKELTDPQETIDATKPPIAEGHTRDVEQKTTVNPSIKPAPKVLGPEETAFAKAYPKDASKYKVRELTKYKIQLFDHDDFGIMAEVDPATHDLTIVIETTKGSKAQRNFVGSKYLWAKDLYPKMYEHFAQQGVEVKSVSGSFMWDNVRETSIPLYDKLMGEAMAANPNLAGAELKAAQGKAAIEAVKVAKTFHYHAEAGISRVSYAKKDGQAFDFKIER